MSSSEKIYEKALDDIIENVGEWFQGDKYTKNNGCNDGEGFVSDTECIAYNALDKIRNLKGGGLND